MNNPQSRTINVQNTNKINISSISLQVRYLAHALDNASGRIRLHVSALSAWFNAKSETFSTLCGEEFTHKDVLIAHAAVSALLAVVGLVGAMEGGAL